MSKLDYENWTRADLYVPQYVAPECAIAERFVESIKYKHNGVIEYYCTFKQLGSWISIWIFNANTHMLIKKDHISNTAYTDTIKLYAWKLMKQLSSENIKRSEEIAIKSKKTPELIHEKSEEIAIARAQIEFNALKIDYMRSANISLKYVLRSKMCKIIDNIRKKFGIELI